MQYIQPTAYNNVALGRSAVTQNNAQWDYQHELLAWQKESEATRQKAAARYLRGMKGSLSSATRGYNTAYSDAKGANEKRYRQLLGLADDVSGQRRDDIVTSYDEGRARMQQQLTSSGMANTTVAPTMALGYERQKQAALDRSGDAATQLKMRVIEGRTDAYPDQSTIIALAQAYGGAVGNFI